MHRILPLKNFASACLVLCHIFAGEILCHWTPAYNHDSVTQLDNPQWMSSIPDDKSLFDISIPGTHESLAGGYWGDAAHCQSLPLALQLQAGIRVLDIRCRHVSNVFAIHHGAIFEHLFFGDVLNVCTQFLEKNPSEVLLLRLKEAHTPANNTRTFEETFKFYRGEFKNYFWVPPRSNSTTPVPSLGEVRGKIVILDDFSSSDAYGLNYRNESLFEIQDDFVMYTNWDLYRKWLEVKQHATKANNPQNRTRCIFVNYLSGADGSFPYFVVSGHVLPGTGAPRLSTGLTVPLWKKR